MNDYNRSILLFNCHLETMYPSVFRSIKDVSYVRERLTTPDDDFLDIDWLKQGSTRLVVISHGLEGNTSRAYVMGMARAFYQNGYDVLAWNYRGCSEEINRNLRFYHSGATDDLDFLIRHVDNKYDYSAVSLIGFSLGGNLTLKYLGEKGKELSSIVKKAVAFSVPLELHSSCVKISMPSNWIYSERFLRSLKKKVIQKSKFHSVLNVTGINSISTLIEFDNEFTAPIHGYKNALDYYTKCSSLYFLQTIDIPTLVINSKNDPFLSKECFPSENTLKNKNLKFTFTEFGGHVGFSLFGNNGLYWSELKALEFIQREM